MELGRARSISLVMQHDLETLRRARVPRANLARAERDAVGVKSTTVRTTAPTVLVLGAGKIGRMIAAFLSDGGEYRLNVADADESALAGLRASGIRTLRVNVTDEGALDAAVEGCDVVVSALSFVHNPMVARAAARSGASYFDLTEDVATTTAVKAIAEHAGPSQIFMSQCGLAPGFISILANDLIARLDGVDSVAMRVGALPQFPSNALKYNLTWSTDGLINEYCNACEAVHEGRRVQVLPLEGLEHFSLDGMDYEAFNTSGGLGTLCDTLGGKVRELNYKTVRYPGHRDLVSFLVNDLRLSERRALLKDVLEKAVPITFQDVVVIFCTVVGWRNGQFVQVSDARKIYPREIGGQTWSAIQITTAAALCSVLDMHFHGMLPKSGFVRQEQVSLADFLANRFGRYFVGPATTEAVARDSRVVP